VSTQALTIVAELAVTGAARAALGDTIAAIRDDVDGNPYLSLAALPGTHFTRFVIIGDHHPTDPLPELMVWESNHDGSTTEYLEQVVAAAPRGIDAVFGGCAGYPVVGAEVAPDAVIGWLRDHAVRAQAFYAAYRELDQETITRDLALREELGRILDAERPTLMQASRQQIHRRICTRVIDAHGALPTDDGDGRKAIWLRRIVVIAAGLVFLRYVLSLEALLALIAAAIGLLVLVRFAEIRDDAAATRVRRPVHDDGRHHLMEDRVMQNQLTHVVDIKPGWLRLTVLWIVLNVIEVMARVFYRDGHLVRMTTIHFARWVILYDRRPRVNKVRRHRLLFFSNYDGSWDAYLGEFIDRGHKGLTAVWSNTVAFPPTCWLILDGAADEEAFKQWARWHQRPVLPGEVQAWWSAVPSATVANVRDATWVRRRLARRMDHTAIAEWLRKL
jgi:hypothetical protein